MRNPLYTVQPVRREHEAFQPLTPHVTARGTVEFRHPPETPPKQIRSGGSEERGPFKNLR
jgi:hypothetical protein